MWWILTTLGVYLHLLTYTERCEICYQNVYWKPKCKCRECDKVICSGCCENIITDADLNYKCPHCRETNQIYNVSVLNKEFFLNLWKRNKLVFIKEGDGEDNAQTT